MSSTAFGGNLVSAVVAMFFMLCGVVCVFVPTDYGQAFFEMGLLWRSVLCFGSVLGLSVLLNQGFGSYGVFVPGVCPLPKSRKCGVALVSKGSWWLC